MRAPMVPAPRTATLLMRFMMANLGGKSRVLITVLTARLKPRPFKAWRMRLGRALLGKFIYHPVILASLDERDFRKFAGDVVAFGCYQDDREGVAAGMSVADGDLEGADFCFCVRKKVF